MKVAILQANLGDFDTPQDPVKQKLADGIEYVFHRFTDENFPPIAGLIPRMQYRLPKLFGWQMFPGYDYYVWLDGTVSFMRDDSLQWYLDQLGKNDIALFHHPQRHSIKAEVDHLEEHLKLGKPYISARYKNGLHKEQYEIIKADKRYIDNKLWASTSFIYANNPRVQSMLREWWFYQSRYFTCDQVPLPWLIDQWGVKAKDFDEPIYKTGYMSLVSHHK